MERIKHLLVYSSLILLFLAFLSKTPLQWSKSKDNRKVKTISTFWHFGRIKIPMYSENWMLVLLKSSLQIKKLWIKSMIEEMQPIMMVWKKCVGKLKKNVFNCTFLQIWRVWRRMHVTKRIVFSRRTCRTKQLLIETLMVVLGKIIWIRFFWSKLFFRFLACYESKTTNWNDRSYKKFSCTGKKSSIATLTIGIQLVVLLEKTEFLYLEMWWL